MAPQAMVINKHGKVGFFCTNAVKPSAPRPFTIRLPRQLSMLPRSHNSGMLGHFHSMPANNAKAMNISEAANKG